MPATTQSASALVAGVQSPEQATVRVRLLRAICIAGQRVEPGDVEVEKALASMLVGARKAERLEPAPLPKAATADPVQESQPRGRRSARAQE